MPAMAESAAQPRPEDWGAIRVPGSWKAQGWPRSSNGLVEIRPATGTWAGFTGARDEQTTRAWYERTLDIPADWTGKEVLLDLERVGTDAEVFVDGKSAGRVQWPGGELPITAFVAPGRSAVLRLLVVATAEAGDAERYMDAHSVIKEAATVSYPGIPGNVFLSSRPRGPHIDNVRIFTSTRRSTLTVEVALNNVTTEGQASLQAVARHAGTVEKEFANQQVRLVATPHQTITVEWPWPDAQRWDIHQPFLYDLSVAVSSDGITDEVTERMGFREFWVEGRNFFMNGTLLRLRPMLVSVGPERTTETYRGFLVGLKAAGMNLAYHWPGDPLERGTQGIDPLLFSLADEMGVLTNAVAPLLHKRIGTDGKQWGSGGKEAFAAELAGAIPAVGNHPAIVLWTTTGNFFSHTQDQNPLVIGMRGWSDNDGRWKQRAKPGQEAIALLKNADPTRVVMTHNGSYVGEVFSVNTYLDLIPLQEREQWLSAWAEQGQMPFIAVEFGTPMDLTFRRGRNGHNMADRSEPLMTEYCAAYLGTQAYREESQAYRQAVAKAHKSADTYAFRSPDFLAEPAYQALQTLFIQNTWRSWRACGVSGGMLPWGSGYLQSRDDGAMVDAPPFQPGRLGAYFPKIPLAWTHYLRPEGGAILPAGRALIDNSQPTLAFIAGEKDLTDKAHSFASAEKIGKRIVLINDQRTVASYTLNWSAIVDGRPIASGADTGTLEVGEIAVKPITFELPNLPGRKKLDGEIQLQATIDGRSLRDRVAFRVFPPAQTSPLTVGLLDPAGRTASLLDVLGVEHKTPVGDPSSLLVIGREALSAEAAIHDAVARQLGAGGTVLVMAQRPQALRALGFRVTPFVSRRVFPVNQEHPVHQGLDAIDLGNWRGDSTLLLARPDYLANDDYPKTPAGMPYAGWHWSNQGGVASGALETPHYGAFRPILQCEFDLAYSPLIEQRVGSGRIIWCQLDLEDHAQSDPAANRLARQLLAYANAPTGGKQADRVLLDGDADDADLLREHDIRSQPALPPFQPGDLLVVGRGGTCRPEDVTRHAQAGGRVLVLPKGWTSRADYGVKRNRAAAAPLLELPDWPELQGVSLSDLRVRTPAETWRLAGGCELAADGLLGRQALGDGVILFIQTDASALNVYQQPFLRYSRWRWTRALSQVLANMGAMNRQRDAGLIAALDAHHPLPVPSTLYHPDYRNDFDYGDDPHRYYRW